MLPNYQKIANNKETTDIHTDTHKKPHNNTKKQSCEEDWGVREMVLKPGLSGLLQCLNH